MQRVVVTGASSMIGAALIRECVKQNVEVLAIVRENCTRMERLPDSELIEKIQCNLDELDKIVSNKIVAHALHEKKTYDVFYHFAWAYTRKNSRDDPVLQEENIGYTLNAVKLAHQLGCCKFIGAGSQAEYGSVDHVVTPNTPAQPQSSYGMAKYAAGILSQKLSNRYGMVHIWGRIFSVYGGNDNEETMLSYAIGQFLKGEEARFSSAAQMWDYLYEDDAAKIFYLLGERIGENKVYCIANGASRHLKEFIIEMKEAFGQNAKCEFTPDTKKTVAGLQPDASELFQDIAYKPAVTFREGIQKMIAQKTKMFKGGG